ncbi:MAG: membrane protein insertion efficiency factor YidD [Actinobacteria bacterium]|nr:membrane protein insertion efficiency factor YidD [Actinomycetota bacterium]
MARALIAFVRLYQLTLGRLAGGQCRFHPSCSEYAVLALRDNGAVRGSWLALSRVGRCGPWTPGGVDYPPERVMRAHG